MATKPITQPEYWATDAVYTTGPFVGQPQKVVPPGPTAAEGHRPGALFPTPAEYENSQQYNITGLCQWTFAGSSAGAADAHICEVDANGEGQVERWRVVPANPNSYALFVQAPPGAGFAIQATGASALGDATILGASTGPGAAVEGVSTAAGACINAVPSGSGHGFTCTVGGTGRAISVTGGTGDVAISATGGAGQIAIVANSGNNANAAIVAAGNGTALGVDAAGGSGAATAAAVRGTAAHDDAPAIYGRSSATATTSGTGVTAEGRGSGAGLRALAAAFHAAIFQGDTSSPLFAAVRFIGANARPSSVQGGAMEYVTAETQFVVGDVDDNAFRGVWTTTGGKATAYTASAFGAQNLAQTAGTINWQVAAECEALDGNAPKAAGREAVLRFRCTAKCVTGPGAGGTWLSVRLFEVNSGLVLPESTRAGIGATDGAGFHLPNDTTTWQTSIVYDFRFTPGTGNKIYQAQIRATEMTEIRVRDCSLTLDGLF